MPGSGLELWANKNSTCTQRITFTAAELNAPYKFNNVDVWKGQHKSPEHLKRQPFGKVPAAAWDGQPFYESRAICRILAEANQNKAQLLPKDLKAKAVFEQWASLENNTITPLFDVLCVEGVFKKMRDPAAVPDQAAIDSALEKLEVPMQVLDKQLSEHEYIAGQFSLVDIFYTPSWQHLQNTPAGKQVLDKYPHFAAWWKRVSSRPAWQKVLAEKDQTQ